MTFTDNTIQTGLSPRLWVTRSHHPFATSLFLDQINSIGIVPWHYPLVHINYTDQPLTLPISDIGGLVLTSVHGMDGFLQAYRLANYSESDLKTFKHSCPVYAVGATTGAYCRHMGFDNIIMGEGTSEKLIKTIYYNHKNKQKKLLYARGVHVTNTLGEKLEKLGFETFENIVYSNTYTDFLPFEQGANLQKSPPWGITVHSIKTAQAINNIMEKNYLKQYFDNVHVFCFSTAIGDTIAKRTPVQVHVAQNLISAIKQVL